MSVTRVDIEEHCFCEWCEPDGECACTDCEGK